MKRERKTYEYRCDACGLFDLASGEGLPPGWVGGVGEIRSKDGRSTPIGDLHYCQECARPKE